MSPTLRVLRRLQQAAAQIRVAAGAATVVRAAKLGIKSRGIVTCEWEPMIKNRSLAAEAGYYDRVRRFSYFGYVSALVQVLETIFSL